MPYTLRGVSAASRDAVLAAVDAASGAPGELGTQLFGVTSTLSSSPALRRVLTDPSSPAQAKSSLVDSVFGGAVGSDALAVAKAAVALRWSAGRDLVDALEVAGIVATVNAARSAGQLDKLETELFEVGRLIGGHPELRSAVGDGTTQIGARTELVTSLLGSKVLDTTLALVTQAVHARRGSFERTLAAFAQIVANRHGRTLAEVRVARPLGDDAERRLSAALSAKYGRDIQLNVILDPAVIGGISVSLADDVVDGTMSSRLEAARRRLAG